MSLSETQAIFQELQRIDELLSRIEGSTAAMEKRLPETTALVMTTQQALRLLWRMASLMRKLGLPEDVSNAIHILTTVARVATYAYYAFHLLSLGTPYGILAGGIGLAGMAFQTTSIGDALVGY